MDAERLAVILATTLVLLGSSKHYTADAENRHVFLDWEVSYAVRSPLGVARRVITIDGRLPGPLLNLTTNDVAHINVVNTLDEPFLLTWNGLQMRRNSWNDGVAGTNCAIPPGENWTYVFQAKDEVGSFFYRPSLGLHAAAGGHGPIRVNNRPVIAVPFAQPNSEFDVLIGDWYNMDVKEMKGYLDRGRDLPSPDGILINGLGPYAADFTFKPGRTYRLRVSNVGTRTSLSFRIQGHKLLLVETEGTYTLQKHYASLDVHPGQSLSVLVTADQPPKPSYYMVVSSLFVEPELFGVANVLYAGSGGPQPPGAAPLEDLSSHNGYNRSMEQARTVRMNLTCGAARPNPQGSFHYGQINMSRTLLLRNDEAGIGGRRRCTVNGVSFAVAATPLKLADHFDMVGVFVVISGRPEKRRQPSLGTAVIDARYRDFVQIVFENRLPSLQTWHLDGYSFFVAGMGWGTWSPDARSTYNLVDAIYRSTVQVYPSAWTAVLVSLDNEGMWNLRSQSLDRRYLGQEIYMRVSQGSSEVPDPRDELPMPPNALLCGKAKSSKIGQA
ncbi:monocopper oxidase-like protein SKS1 [Panicum miliaceum]|uniref:Monocopper oxidase-like protein SKS1 n=1 Tax=Panicum miliaceum TaxID=4540 RepID=A0A3L6RRK9_PANMI|nr:monocopper oxidase-like protein SKS1 [Panicum miliaceum]